MPGITGIIKRRRAGGMPPEVRLDRMVQALVHEPSYVSGTYVNEELGVWLGWACLEHAFANCMPIWNETRDVLMVLHGEVFADQSTLAGLRTRGHTCSLEDASYLVHLYEEQGMDAIAAWNGFFSGVVVDLRRGEAVLFNDRYGMQRVYCHETEEELLFSSEAKSLLRVSPELRKISTRGRAERLVVGCVLENRSLFEKVVTLPGASLWVFERGGALRKSTYFSRQSWEEQTPLAPGEFYAEFSRVFAEVLPRYLHSHKRIGISLTGGLDTRLIMACGRPQPGSLPCYTFASRYRDSYDVRIAREVAGLCGQDFQALRLDNGYLARFPELAAKSVYVSDGNFDVTGSAELYANQEALSIGPVRLTGNYGSEIVRGDGEFRPGRLGLDLFAPEFRSHCQEAVRSYQEIGVPHRVSFAAFRQAPWFNYSRLSLEQSKLRVRTPFMDNDLVALMYRLPPGYGAKNELSFRLIQEGNPRLSRILTDRGERIRGAGPAADLFKRWRWLLKRGELCFDYGMPQRVARVDRWLRPLHLEKLFLGRFGFLHFRTWLRADLAGYLQEMLLDQRALGRPILQPASVRQAVRDHVQGRRNHTLDLVKLLTYELLERQLIEATDGTTGGS